MKVLVIIPAKTDSKRLPKKNLQKINGKTLIEHSIEYAKECEYIDRDNIILSTESSEVISIAIANGVRGLIRPKSLCGDTEVTDVYIDVLNNINEKYDYVVCLQPDHPDREHTLKYCIDYMINNNYDDLITIEPDFKSGSVRVFKYNHLIKSHVSKRIGCIKDDATDIHYLEDLKQASLRIK